MTLPSRLKRSKRTKYEPCLSGTPAKETGVQVQEKSFFKARYDGTHTKQPHPSNSKRKNSASNLIRRIGTWMRWKAEWK
ncbi:hypothetical protein MKW98_008487 [Papaver atlanticum]|uniref:Uncharacterized protein n=1 Tax=Papaver atlanticum TaxID=357466 RepID=A0AAD4S169_9MAGN|nr:hypothetical protein MKW98_008487 [Papaver atlanticum]